MKKFILTVLALVHIGCVLYGAFKMPWWSQLPSSSTMLYRYGEISGTSQNYSFFAPNVAPALRGSLRIVETTGETVWLPLNLRGHEANLRLEALLYQFVFSDERTRRGIAASWAALGFNRFDLADTIEVIIEFHDLPSMEAFRAGSRPQWLPLYKGQFARVSENKPAASDY